MANLVGSSTGSFDFAQDDSVCLFAPLRPARCHLRASRCVIIFAGVRNAFIEHHRDIPAERRLNFHRYLRRYESARAVDVILKVDAFLGDLAQLRERENLISTAVGENRPIPIHEIVQAAKMLDHIEAGPNEQVVCVSENDLRIQFAQFSRADAFHGTLRTHRHERRRIDHAMRRR